MWAVFVMVYIFWHSWLYFGHGLNWMVLRTPAVMLPKFCKNYCGSLVLFLDGLFILCLWLWLDVVFQSHLRVPGAWDLGTRQSGIRATEVWVTLGSEGSGFEAGYCDRLR